MEKSPRYSTAGIAHLSARHPWRTLGFWLLLLVLAALSASTLGSALTTEGGQLNHPESKRGMDLLEQRLRGPQPISETIIVRSESTTVDDPAFEATVNGLVSKLQAVPDLTDSVTSYYGSGNPAMVSADRHSTIISVIMNGTLDEAIDRVPDYEAALASAQKDDYLVYSIGDATLSEAFSKIADEDLSKGETIGIPVAIVILIVLLGALVAAGLPLVVGFVSIFIALGLAALAGRATDLSFFVVNVIFMIGLAVGIDYALFIISRYREERARGLDKYDAIAVTGGTANKAVLFSGSTVVLALSSMFLVPELTFHSLGIGAVLVVIVAVAASLTLLPALLSIAGDKINWPRLRRKQTTARTVDPHAITYKGFWGRVTKQVMAHPGIALVLAGGLLIALALPVVDMNRGSSGVSSMPKSIEAYTAYSLLERDFPAGTIAPVEIVVDGQAANPQVIKSIDALTAQLATDERFGPVSTVSNKAGDLTLVSVPLTIEPDNPAAYSTIEDLRQEIVPAAFKSAPAKVMVAGQVAVVHDGNLLSEQYLPIVIGFVLALSFVLLTVAFRSIVVPVKALIMNLLSVGASYGLIVLVFQKGFGSDLLGLQTVPMIESWLPLFLFSILFGLSMDYHVFLLSRIREHYDLTGDNKEAVAFGLQSTAKLITGAASIMVVVFAGFAAGRLVMLQQIGFGLAVAILIDATIVRSIMVPSSMVLLGDRNWYFPTWLSWLPRVTIEGHAPAMPALPLFAATSTSGDD
ncbi:MAG: MMPL family transporter [Thermomicrobiales bacterium]|nr:MMPL family transporter [Thermomicrobiales bacterium]